MRISSFGLLRLAALGFFACGSGKADQVDGSAPLVVPAEVLTDLDPQAAVEQRAWRECGTRIECREIEVPLDYGDPGGAKIELALSRAQHWAGHDFHGVILVNPGGPGVPGKPFVQALDARRAFGFLQGFDLVGFDPRGVGDSGSVSCGSGHSPSSAFEIGGTDGLIRQFEADGEDCAERMGPLFEHLGSQEVVRDMDAIRQALGQEQLNFLGASYGTRLGALYAETFPELTRAIVLDGPVQPSADLAELVSAQFDALIEAVGAFFEDCSSGLLDCPYDAESVADSLWVHSVQRQSEDLFAGLWKGNLAQPTGRADLADFLYLYSFYPEVWDEIIDSAAGDATLPIEVVVNQTVNCADQTQALPSRDEIEGLIAGYGARAPSFVATGLAVAVCAGWHVTPDPVPHLTAPDSPPLLLIGGEHDILTPRAFADEMDASLVRSTLVMSGHYGHGAVLAGNACVEDIVNGYFTDLTLPEEGTACP